MDADFSGPHEGHFSNLLRKLGKSLHAKLVCAQDGLIVYRNEVCQGLLSAGDGLVEKNGRLSSVHDLDARSLKRAISEVMETTAAETSDYVALTLNRRQEGGFLEVLIEPVISPGATDPGDDRAAGNVGDGGRAAGGDEDRDGGDRPAPSDGPDRTLAMVTVAVRPHSFAIREDVLRDLYRLTQAEARVVNALVNGHSLVEIARELEVSKNTIRSQLQSIFSKTHTRRQSDLVNLILTGVAVEHWERPG